MQLLKPILLGFAFCLVGAGVAFSQNIQARAAPSPIPPRTLPPSLVAAAMPPNPGFLVNRRQADLRDHHLIRAPIAVAPRAPFAVLPAIPKGMPTRVAPMDAGADSPIVITYNTPLRDAVTGGLTSTVTEPSVADTKGGIVLAAGNWFASISKDDGQNYAFRNPSSAFPSDGFEWCCDQVVIYDPTRDLLIWYLQYVQNGHQNIGRIAVASGEAIAAEKWVFYDLSPLNVGGWDDEWFDYADLAITANHLYLSTNSFATHGTAFSEDDSFARAAVVRIELDDLAKGRPISPMVFDAEDGFSLKPTHGANNEMYFGSHDFAAFEKGIVVFEWAENSDTIVRHKYAVHEWSNAGRESIALDGTEWLRRTDFRMTAGWAKGRSLGFGWTAAQDSNFRHPHVRIAIIDLDAADPDDRVRQAHIWSDEYAFAYPYTAVSASGSVGVSLHYGGGGIEGVNPSHAVGVLKEAHDGSYSWVLQQSAAGTNGPIDGRWGDYLAVRPSAANAGGWIATGYTLVGGGSPEDIIPRVIRFEEAGIAPTAAAVPPVDHQLREKLRQLQTDIDDMAKILDME